MKVIKNKLVLWGLFSLAVVGGGLAYWSGPSSHETGGQEEKAIDYYTCPMHPQIHEDEPGECPICHMKLVPVYREGHSDHEGKEPGFKISSERQQLIGIRTAPVERGPVVKELRTVGRVAFDPKLAVAEREFLEIVRNVPSLKAAARSHLRVLGLSDPEIDDLAKKARQGSEKLPTDLYLPGEGESVWVYATLYQDELDLVQPGQSATVTIPGKTEVNFPATVRSVDPVLESATRTARARIEVPKAGGKLRPEGYVNVEIRLDLGEAVTIPRSALIDTGVRRVVFVRHGPDHFSMHEVKLGPEFGERVVVTEGVEAGQEVVADGAFLVDSESQLKAAVTGGHQH